MNQINVVTIGKLIEAHREGDEQKFKKTWQGFPLIHVGEELPHISGCTNVRAA
jgi:hypothetical protein